MRFAIVLRSRYTGDGTHLGATYATREEADRAAKLYCANCNQVNVVVVHDDARWQNRHVGFIQHIPLGPVEEGRRHDKRPIPAASIHRAAVASRTERTARLMERKNPLEPALKSVARLRIELTKRIGKPEGNLNKLVLSELDTIEATLLQVVPLGDMMRVLNQQTEVAVNSFRSLDRLALVSSSRLPDNGGDDGTSETKGQ